uniref:Putative secreted protein n=1 Tax=Amblyomma triste TaxID=251400 RepID=A0A023G3F1_AMBTT
MSLAALALISLGLLKHGGAESLSGVTSVKLGESGTQYLPQEETSDKLAEATMSVSYKLIDEMLQTTKLYVMIRRKEKEEVSCHESLLLKEMSLGGWFLRTLTDISQSSNGETKNDTLNIIVNVGISFPTFTIGNGAEQYLPKKETAAADSTSKDQPSEDSNQEINKDSISLQGYGEFYSVKYSSQECFLLDRITCKDEERDLMLWMQPTVTDEEKKNCVKMFRQLSSGDTTTFRQNGNCKAIFGDENKTE